jgi:preprotein translocase subunit SecA
MKYTPKSMVFDGSTLGRLSRDLDKAQFRTAASQAQWYKTYAAFDDVLAQQQRVIYTERNSILHQQDQRAHVAAVLDEVLTADVRTVLKAGSHSLSLVARLTRLYPVVSAPAIDIAMRSGGKDPVAAFLAAVRRDVRQAYENREAQLGEDIMRKLERAAFSRQRTTPGVSIWRQCQTFCRAQ